MIEETEAEIDAEDPDWREREHINLYGKSVAVKRPYKEVKIDGSIPP